MKKRFFIVAAIISLVIVSCAKPSRNNQSLLDDSSSTQSLLPNSISSTSSSNNKKILYTIDFDLNGGTSTSYTGSKTVEAFTKDVFFFDCVKEGWNFRGWSYNGTKILDEKGNQLANPEMANSMTFVAIYAQTAKMSIITNLDGAGNITGEGEYPYNTYVDVSAYAKQGYVFIGWYFENTLLSNSNDYKYMMWSEDVTLEARFKLDSFLMNVHTNNDTYGLVLLKSPFNNNYLSEYEEYRDYTTAITISSYSKTDVRFLGWFDVNNQLVETNAVYSFVMPNYDYTLEAKWNYFNIDYILNGGTNNPNNPTSYTIESSNMSLLSPTKAGYDFAGWTYKGDYVTEINPNWIENITLVANWKEHPYSITYELNGGTNNSSNPTSYTIESSAISLKDPSRLGYTFDGWYSNSSFSNKVTQIPANSYGNITLYAKWTVITYSITYELNGGVNASTNPSTYTVNDSVTFASPTRTGYTFLGWYDGDDQVTSIQTGTTGALSLEAHWNDGDSFVVTLDPNGGEVTETSIEVQYDHAYSLPTPTRLGYTFAGWYDGSTLISNSGTWQLASNKILVAHWTIINYSITYELNGGVNSSTNPSTYTVNDNVTFASPTRTGYTFLGWYDGDNQATSIQAGTTGALSLEAHWNDGDSFVITLDPNSGEVTETSIEVQYDHAYSLPTPTKPYYSFDGWYDGSVLVSNNSVWKFNSSKTFTAHWTALSYPIIYNLNGGTNAANNPAFYTIESSFVLISPTKTGYTFLGWYDECENKITSISVGTTGTLILTARWSVKQNVLLITSEDASKGTVAITSGSGYSGESITVVATPIDDCVFKGWYNGESKVSDDNPYTFEMPADDYSLVAHFFTKAEEIEEWNISHGIIPTLSEDGKTMTYGLYPQTNVDSPALLSALDELTTPESNGWYLYDNDYYAKVSATPCNSSYVFDNGTAIVPGTNYWFKCEPITWNVLSKSYARYYVVSFVLLDAHCYYNSEDNRIIEGETIYPNNYEYSDIRTWLNNDFYNSAFALGNSYIQTTTVDNSASTTDSSTNSYACNNTQDKVFLPSYQDYINSNYGFSPSIDLTNTSNTRYCKTTDWARARGAAYSTKSSSYYLFDTLYNGYYWTRSPISDKDGARGAWMVETDGTFLGIGVWASGYSVRPAMTIKTV